MLDKNHCKVLKYLNKFDMTGCKATPISISTKINLDDVYQILNYLQSTNYVEQLPNCNWRILYLGKQYKKIYFEQQFLKYWFPILTAVISYILSLITSLLMK